MRHIDRKLENPNRSDSSDKKQARRHKEGSI